MPTVWIGNARKEFAELLSRKRVFWVRRVGGNDRDIKALTNLRACIVIEARVIEVVSGYRK